jgi:hypothetical protein
VAEIPVMGSLNPSRGGSSAPPLSLGPPALSVATRYIRVDDVMPNISKCLSMPSQFFTRT